MVCLFGHGQTITCDCLTAARFRFHFHDAVSLSRPIDSPPGSSQALALTVTQLLQPTPSNTMMPPADETPAIGVLDKRLERQGSRCTHMDTPASDLPAQDRLATTYLAGETLQAGLVRWLLEE